MKTFEMKTAIHFGENALERLENIPYKRVLIITDPFVVQSKMIDLITRPLDKAGKEYDIFHNVVPDAPVDKIADGVKKFLSYQPEAIIAVGGGSAIDSSKAIREFALKINHYGEVGLIAIPTTSGTGSEVTSFAVVNDTEAKVKYPLVSDSLTADEAILDAELVKSVPPAITADTGMDVFTHALESYVSTGHNEFSAALAEKAMEICGVFLLRAYLDGSDMHARQKMHVASCLAGLSFNTAGLGITHSMAHQLGAMFHIPHGRANAMLLPHIVEFNANINKRSRSQKTYLPAVERYALVAHILGLSNYNQVMSVRSLVNWIQFMQKEMNIPMTIQELGTITPDAYFAAVDKMAEAALADTTNGDKGTTNLVRTKNVSKSDDRIQLVGTIDELTSHLGLIKTMMDRAEDIHFIEGIQKNLNTIVSGVADPFNREFKTEDDQTGQLEDEINRLDGLFSCPKEGNILPGSSRLSAELDIARAVARRAERDLAAVSVKFGADNGAKKYMNRLSDYLYIMARYTETTEQPVQNQEESRPSGGKEAEPVAAVQTTATSEAVIQEVLKRMGIQGRITLDSAKRLIDKIEQEAARRGKKAVIAVCGPDGNPIAVHVMDGAFLVSFDVATKKAYTAVAVKMSTKELSVLAQPGGTFYGVDKMDGGRIVIFGGGVPLKVGDTIIGGLGISGGTGEEDHSLAEYGLSVLNEVL